jgi:hypothetical protein
MHSIPLLPQVLCSKQVLELGQVYVLSSAQTSLVLEPLAPMHDEGEQEWERSLLPRSVK